MLTWLRTRTALEKLQDLGWLLVAGLLVIGLGFVFELATSKDFDIGWDHFRTTTPVPEAIQRCEAAQKAHGTAQQAAAEQVKSLPPVLIEMEREIGDLRRRRRAEIDSAKRDFDLFASQDAARRVDDEIAKLESRMAVIAKQLADAAVQSSSAQEMISEACPKLNHTPAARMFSSPAPASER